MPSKLDGSELESSRAVAEARSPKPEASYLRAPAVSFLLLLLEAAAPLRMPRTSSSFMMMKSSPSILISVPEYLPNRMRSSS